MEAKAPRPEGSSALDTIIAQAKTDRKRLDSAALGPVSLTALGIASVVGAGIFVSVGTGAARVRRARRRDLVRDRRARRGRDRPLLRGARVDDPGGGQHLLLRLRGLRRLRRLVHRLGPAARVPVRGRDGRRRAGRATRSTCSTASASTCRPTSPTRRSPTAGRRPGSSTCRHRRGRRDTALLAFGMRQSARANNSMVFLKMAILILFVVVGAFAVTPTTGARSCPSNEGGFGDYGASRRDPRGRARLLRLRRLRRGLDRRRRGPRSRSARSRSA